MSNLKMMSAGALALVAALTVPASAQADDHHFGRVVPVYPYAGPAWAYGEFAAPYPYYDREYRRAQERASRDFRKHQKREAKAYKKLRRTYEKYQAEYGYPYGFEYDVTPYQWQRDQYRFLRRPKRHDDEDWDD